ncbi:hypothetical protein OsI_31284 [Oryza sativa Indica Group]|nr:hypothetical protein OsI_31284 [Oryza sativa Indica Group]
METWWRRAEVAEARGDGSRHRRDGCGRWRRWPPPRIVVGQWEVRQRLGGAAGSAQREVRPEWQSSRRRWLAVGRRGSDWAAWSRLVKKNTIETKEELKEGMAERKEELKETKAELADTKRVAYVAILKEQVKELAQAKLAELRWKKEEENKAIEMSQTQAVGNDDGGQKEVYDEEEVNNTNDDSPN